MLARLTPWIWIGVVALAGCESTLTTTQPPPPPTIDAELRRSIANWGVIPIGPMPPQPPAQVQLGRALFSDKILSGNRDISCATCHQPSASLGDGLSLAVGTGGTGHGAGRTPGSGRQFVPRNAPSLLNSGLGLYQLFWDGRLAAFGPGGSQDSGLVIPPGLPNLLTAQALLPVLNRREMRGEPGDIDGFGNPNELAALADNQPSPVWQAIMKRLLAIPEYVAMFQAAFPGQSTSALRFEHAARALATFQMEAFTKARSPFDRYLDRDDFALSTEQKRGALLFFGKARCASCHNGPFLGGQSIANTGAPQIGPGGVRQPPLDLGRGEIDSSGFYDFAFRAAPLRNVELTAPYMHSGAYATLEAVVRHYNDVPRALREYDVAQLAPAFRALYHGDEATISSVLATLDHQLRLPLDLSPVEIGDLVAFLKSLTDPDARDLRLLFPATVPSGLPIQD